MGLGLGFNKGFYSAIQLDVGYRVLPELSVGGALEWGTGGSGDECSDGRNCPPTYVALGPRVEVSPANFLVTPWIGGGFAVDHLYRSNASSLTYFNAVVLESTWDVGIEVRPTRGFGIGPCFALKFLVTEPYETPPRDDDAHRIGLLQLRVTGRL